jgi:hypothetical protein
MKHIWTVGCARLLTDKDTNNLTLVEVVEEVTFQVSPEMDITRPFDEPVMFPLSWTVVSNFMREDVEKPERGLARMMMAAPGSDARKVSGDIGIDLTEFRRFRVVIPINGLPVTRPGTYLFTMEVSDETGWQRVAELPLDVRLVH